MWFWLDEIARLKMVFHQELVVLSAPLCIATKILYLIDICEFIFLHTCLILIRFCTVLANILYQQTFLTQKSTSLLSDERFKIIHSKISFYVKETRVYNLWNHVIPANKLYFIVFRLLKWRCLMFSQSINSSFESARWALDANSGRLMSIFRGIWPIFDS